MPSKIGDSSDPEFFDESIMPAPVISLVPVPAAQEICGAHKGPFTDAEDRIIKETVEHSGTYAEGTYHFSDWRIVTERLPGRAGKQIRDRWVNYLNPALNRSPFSRDDDLKLNEALEDLGPKWKEISDKYFKGTRSENMIKNRYHSAAYKRVAELGFPEDAREYLSPAEYFGSLADAATRDDGGAQPKEKEGNPKDEGSNVSDRVADESSGSSTEKETAESASPAEKENGGEEESKNESDKEKADASSPGESKIHRKSACTPSAEEEADEEKAREEDGAKPDAKEKDGEKNAEEDESKPQAKEVDGEETAGEGKPKPLAKEIDEEKPNEEDQPMPPVKEIDEEEPKKEVNPMPPAREVDEKKPKEEDESMPLAKEVDGEKTDKEDELMDKESEDKVSSGETKSQGERKSTPVLKEVDGEKTDKEDEPPNLSNGKRKEHADRGIELPAKKRKEATPMKKCSQAATMPPTRKPTQPGLPLHRQMVNQQMMHPKMMHPHMANSQMMNPQMMNPQMMMQWGQFPPQFNIMPGIVPPFAHPAQANIAAQQMMMMMGQGAPQTNAGPAHPVPPGNCHRVILTLPPPNVKLGILLDDNPIFGLPELKSVTKHSPIRSQIPTWFHSDCCVVSLQSQAIGHVEPKTARNCAMLISKSQEGTIKPVELRMVLVGTKTPSATTPSPQPKEDSNPRKQREGGRKSAEEKYVYDQMRRMALLDFFSDERKPTIGFFIREKGLPEKVRSAMGRVIQSDNRLAQLLEMRDNPERRKEAYDIIDKIIPDTSIEKAEADKAAKLALLDFFSGSSRGTLDKFCEEKNLDQRVHNIMKRSIENDEYLSLLVNYRDDADKRKHAVKMITNLFPDNAEEKYDAHRKQKTALLEFFNDSSGCSLASFCEENGIDVEVRCIMGRFIDRDKRLPQLVDKRHDAELREEAMNIIERLLPGIPTRYSKIIPPPKKVINKKPDAFAKAMTANTSKDVACQTAPLTAYTQSRNIFFSPDNIKEVANKLDFDARPRMARDGSKEIAVHDRKVPDELLILLTFDLFNRVVKGRALLKKNKDNTLVDCAQLLFYDHGYKKVSGISNLEKTWETRLEEAYISGADMSPVNRNYCGSVSYTDRIEKDHPGLLMKLYEYTEERIGKDAPFGEKAMFMNEKSVDDAADNPHLPVLELNKTQLFRWARQQKQGEGEGAEGSAQSKSDGDTSSLEQIEKKHPGLIDELYNFAVEAMGPDASHHIIATCMNEKSKEDVEENPTLPSVTVSKTTLPNWIKKRGL